MGDIVRPGPVPMRLAAEVIGTAPIERVDVLHGTRIAQSVRPYAASDLGRRVRVLWQGAEYRGRGRETHWRGRLTVTGNRIVSFAPVNFLNPERQVHETIAGAELAWNSVTTGNLAGIDLWLEKSDSGTVRVESNVVSGEVDLATLADETFAVRRRRSRTQTKHLSSSRDGLEPAGRARTRCNLSRRSGLARLSAGDASRWPPGVVEPDLPDRLSADLLG